MASLRRFARTMAKNLNPRHPSLSLSSRLPLPLPLYNRTFEQNKQRHVPEGLGPVTQKLTGYTILAGLLGFGLADIAYADKNEAADNTFPPTESDIVPPPIGFGETPLSPESTKTVPSPESPPASSNEDLEETAKKEKLRLETLLRSKGVRYGSFPRFTVSVKGRKLTIKFKVPPSCEIPILITSLVSRLGVNADCGVGLDMMVQAWDSGVAWQLALSRPKTHKESVGGQVQAKDKIGNDGELCILMFRPLISSDYAEIEFMKEGSFTSEEMDALVSVLQLSGQPRSLESRPRGDVARAPTTDKTIANLEAMGVKIYGLKQTNDEQPKADISWDNIAGYDQQKREIEDTILLALKSPEVYDDIARGTRCKFETNRPRAVLFEGPPGLTFHWII